MVPSKLILAALAVMILIYGAILFYKHSQQAAAEKQWRSGTNHHATGKSF